MVVPSGWGIVTAASFDRQVEQLVMGNEAALYWRLAGHLRKAYLCPMDSFLSLFLTSL